MEDRIFFPVSARNIRVVVSHKMSWRKEKSEVKNVIELSVFLCVLKMEIQ